MDTWVAFPRPNPKAPLRLFSFPYAGGGTSIFHTWLNFLPPEIELCPIRLPGREGRLKEKPYARLSPLVDVIAEALTPLLDKPFAFFGHSMGALICFELARHLRRQNRCLPNHMFVSGHNAPQLPEPNPPLHHLADAKFITRVQELYGGIPMQILEDHALMELFVPILRADFAIVETYVYRVEPQLDIPISVFGGQQDNQTSQEGLAAWREQTISIFSVKMFPGNHFFLQNNQAHLLSALTRDLTEYLYK